MIPISLSCWPSPTKDGVNLVVELELTDDKTSLSNLLVKIPAPSSASPQVISSSMGECNYDHHNECVVWSLESLNSNENAGTLELTASCDEAAIFPLIVEASRPTQLLDLQILEAYHMTTKDPIKYDLKQRCTYVLTVER
jgi:hypothetical protein